MKKEEMKTAVDSALTGFTTNRVKEVVETSTTYQIKFTSTPTLAEVQIARQALRQQGIQSQKSFNRQYLTTQLLD